jgi:hypothetical protein
LACTSGAREELAGAVGIDRVDEQRYFARVAHAERVHGLHGRPRITAGIP